MARLRNGGNGAISMATLWPTSASQIQKTNARTSTLYDITLTDGTRLQYTGTGLTYTAITVSTFIPSGGTYSQIDLRTSAGLLLATIDQFGSRNAGEIVGSNPSPLASVFSGADSITGFSFSDSLIGGDAADTINGGGGNDTIAAGFGLDSLDGGADVDTNIMTHYDGPVVWNMTTGLMSFPDLGSSETAVNFEIAIMGNGADSITGTDGDNTLVGNGGNDTLDGGFFFGTGSFANNTITGGGGDDRLDGAGGNDRLVGNGGNDTLDGGAGDDTLVGVAGNTVYVVDSAADVIVESALDTADEVRTTLNIFTLGSTAGSAKVERLTFIGTGNFSGTGDGAANIITGGGGG
jgi:Ca2+-binding RTX toxin-like protein